MNAPTAGTSSYIISYAYWLASIGTYNVCSVAVCVWLINFMSVCRFVFWGAPSAGVSPFVQPVKSGDNNLI